MSRDALDSRVVPQHLKSGLWKLPPLLEDWNAVLQLNVDDILQYVAALG